MFSFLHNKQFRGQLACRPCVVLEVRAIFGSLVIQLTSTVISSTMSSRTIGPAHFAWYGMVPGMLSMPKTTHKIPV